MNCSKGFVRLFFALLLVFVVLIVGQPVFAALITTGEVFPVDPSTWDPSTTAYVGIGGTGSVTADAGTTIVSEFGYLGYGPGSIGEVTIDEAGSAWTNSRFLYVGFYGDSTLDITDGGAVSSTLSYIGSESGSTGVVTIDGAGSTLTSSHNLYVGHYGSGALNIIGGGTVSDKYGYIGNESGSTGEVTVYGAGSTWTNSNILYVGRNGSGTLNITDGGTINARDCLIGDKSGSTGIVNVDGAGSTLNSESNFIVGCRGCGTVNVTGGGTVNSYHGAIGFRDSTGEVTVDGAGSTWNSSHGLSVGSSGSGVLNITNGGVVDAHFDTWVAYGSDSSGEIHFENGTLTAGGLGCSFDDLSGTGTINTHGLVSDVDLVFDATHGFNKTFAVNENVGQDVTINLDVFDTYYNRFRSLGAGYSGEGTMSVSDGIVVESVGGYIGFKSGSTGEVTVDGVGSAWNTYLLNVGNYGDGTLNITGGATVETNHVDVNIGHESGSTGTVNVDGVGSTLTNYDRLNVGKKGSGTLNITGGGLVSVVGQFMIDDNGDGDSFVNMATGGMLALEGEADESIGQFLGLVQGTDAIRYWDGGAWAHISGATAGSDYTLEYLTGGELTGFTKLTVMTAVPEPSSVVLILVGIGALLVVRRRRR
jgi:fibronectin-binding autotransporter adhesin